MKTAKILTGKQVADHDVRELSARIDILRNMDVSPTLQLVRVGDNEDSIAYEKSILRSFTRLGVDCRTARFPRDVTESDLADSIASMNEDPSVHGILILEPLPSNIQASVIHDLVSPSKDVDGLSCTNQGLVYRGDETAFAPCTASAVVHLLDFYRIPLEGSRVTIVGRSVVVGRPLAMLLLGKNATVTVCHSRTRELADRVREADIVVVGIGQREMLNQEYFRQGQVVIDVGIHADPVAGVVGDVDISSVGAIVDTLVPAKGGVGSVTTTVLIGHTIAAAEKASRTNV